MAHPSQTTLQIDLPTLDDINVDETNQVSLLKGATVIDSTGSINASAATFVCVIPAGGGDAIFLKKGVDYTTSTPLGGVWTLRNPLPFAATVYYGGCHAPAFVVPQGCRTVTITQADITNPFYWRKGTANQVGYTIAKPDANPDLDNVQGSPVYGHAISSELDEWEPGAEIHLMGGASDQVVIVAFNTAA